MTRRRKSTNTDDTAIEAAAERFLADLRAKRVAKAESDLAVARDRLAKAQADSEQAAANYAQHPWDGNRKAVLAAREEVELVSALAEHAERALAKARERFPRDVRERAIARVRAEREWQGIRAKREAIEAKLADATGALVAAVREMNDLVMAQAGLALELRHSKEAFEGRAFDHDYPTPDPTRLAGGAIADACRDAKYSPYDFRSLAVAAASVYADARELARPSMLEQPRPAPDGAQATEQREAWQRSVQINAQATG